MLQTKKKQSQLPKNKVCWSETNFYFWVFPIKISDSFQTIDSSQFQENQTLPPSATFLAHSADLGWIKCFLRFYLFNFLDCTKDLPCTQGLAKPKHYKMSIIQLINLTFSYIKHQKCPTSKVSYISVALLNSTKIKWSPSPTSQAVVFCV